MLQPLDSNGESDHTTWSKLLDLAKAQVDEIEHDATLLECSVNSAGQNQNHYHHEKDDDDDALIFLSLNSLLNIHRKIGEGVHVLQSLSIFTSRCFGGEIGPFKIRSQSRWIRLLLLRKSRRKTELDSLVSKLQQLFQRCDNVAHFLFDGRRRSRSQGHNNNNNPDGSEADNVVDINQIGQKSNQKKWVLELREKLTRVKNWNQDSLLMLHDLIEWDYQHRFSVGESSAEQDIMEDIPLVVVVKKGKSNQAIDLDLDFPHSTLTSSSYSSYPRCLTMIIKKMPTTNGRLRKMMPLIFISVILLCILSLTLNTTRSNKLV